MKNICLYLLLLFFKACISMNIVSYQEKFDINEPAINTFIDSEKTYIQSVMSKSRTKDEVCALSDEKKKELCRIIFETQAYRDLYFYPSKIPLFKAKLPCIQKKLVIKYFHRDVIKQNMYPCFGRHEIVRTSFIEDDYYDMFYLSDGPEVNSVTIYSHLFNKYYGEFNVYDFMYNIDLTKLSDMITLEKDAIKELNLIKNIYRSSFDPDVEDIYYREQNYSEDDPVCSLPYEKKITLCNLIFNDDKYESKIKVTLNKAATEILSMNCTTKPVYNSMKYFQKKLREKQRMYPCHARSLITSTKINLFLNKLINSFFVSSGSRRNSIFVYNRVQQENLNSNYTVIELIENIHITRLESTVISREELKSESEATYIRIQQIMESCEKYYYAELQDLMAEMKSEKIMEKVDRMIDNINKEFHAILESEGRENHQEILEKLHVMYTTQLSNPSRKISSINLNENIGEAQANEIIIEHLFIQVSIFYTELKIPGSENRINLSRFMQIGSQVYQRLLKKIQNEMNKKLGKDKQTKNEEISMKKRNLKSNNKVQTLIKNMEIIVKNIYLESLLKLAEEIDTVGDSKNAQNKKAESKKTKKKKK